MLYTIIFSLLARRAGKAGIVLVTSVRVSVCQSACLSVYAKNGNCAEVGALFTTVLI